MIDEGVIKFRSDWQRSAPLDLPQTALLNRWRRPLHAAGLIGHYDDLDIGYGNLSTRLSGSRQFIITGTQSGNRAELDASHFALVTDYDIGGNRVTSKGASEASSESLTHAMLYDLDPRIRAIVHVHDNDAWSRLAGKLPTTLDNVAYGTPDMAREFGRLYVESDFPERGVAVMAGHEGGMIAIGNSLKVACQRILAATSRAGEVGEQGGRPDHPSSFLTSTGSRRNR